MRIIGVVILYQPDINMLINRINTYLPQLHKLLIYDNSESLNIQLKNLIQEQNNSKLEYVFFGENGGLSKRLNAAVDYAMKNGYDYLLTMDQDSSFELGDFEKYLNKIQQNNLLKVAQFGVNCQKEFTKPTEVPEKVLSLITSGSILNLCFFKEIGFFDERLFIDFVDLEFSYRVNYFGYTNLQFTDIILSHRIGYLKIGRSLKNFKLTPRILHSPIRVYYILRNGLFLLFKVKHINKLAKQDIRRSMMVIKNDFIYHNNLLAVYKNAIAGFFDFLRNKMEKK
jgi:rhamnosyltransferase